MEKNEIITGIPDELRPKANLSIVETPAELIDVDSIPGHDSEKEVAPAPSRGVVELGKVSLYAAGREAMPGGSLDTQPVGEYTPES